MEIIVFTIVAIIGVLALLKFAGSPGSGACKVVAKSGGKGEDLQAGATMTLRLPGGAEMEMVWCPPGRFPMGSNGDDYCSYERPAHEVTLTKGFWMAKYPVTQKQWKSVMGSNPSFYTGDDLPVGHLRWKECKIFCKKTGLRLPTEAEWEYACRAGSRGDYAGTGRLDDMGWYVANSGGHPHAVGQKQPNAWGLYDMHGNVVEWCADWMGNYPSGAVSDPKGASSGCDRVRRGGCYADDAVVCRSAHREFETPSFAQYSQSFRPVCNLSE